MNYWTKRKVLVTGASGFLGKHLTEELQSRGASFKALEGKADCDLRDHWDTGKLFDAYKPDVVFHLAALVGGIGANRARPADFFIDNTMMGGSILNACRDARVEKLVMVGTTCSYPKLSPIPFDESDLWGGYPEGTNAPYGAAKRALIVGSLALEAQYGVEVVNVIPTNLYGPGDNFNPDSSHVIAALMRKMHEAKDKESVELWGTGDATRDFLYVKDAAKGVVDALQYRVTGEPINLGSGQEISIRNLAYMIADAVGFKGVFVWDKSKPDGQPRRCLNTDRAKNLFGWQAKTKLADGLRETYQAFLASQVEA